MPLRTRSRYLMYALVLACGLAFYGIVLRMKPTARQGKLRPLTKPAGEFVLPHPLPPEWLRNAEICEGWYKPVNDDIIARKLSKFPLIILKPDDRSDERAFAEKLHAHGTRVIFYRTFHTWRVAPPEKEEATDPKIPNKRRLLARWAADKRGDMLHLEGWALMEHPEWILYGADGSPSFTAFGRDYHDGTCREPCLNARGVIEACLENVRLTMESGADGIFLDNAHPTPRCFGPQHGKHEHAFAEKSNDEMFVELLVRARKLIKSYSEEKVLVINQGWQMADDEMKYAAYVDAIMREGENYSTWRHTVEQMRARSSYVKAGGIMVCIFWPERSRFPNAPHESAKDNAFLSFVHARLSDCVWSDYYYSDDPEQRAGVEALYSVRLGKPLGEVTENDGFVYRIFERGLVALNRTGEYLDSAARPRSPSRLTLRWNKGWGKALLDRYSGERISPARGGFVARIPPCSGRVYEKSE